MSHIYPKLHAYHSEMLDVGDGHSLFLELSGNPKGIPVLYIHGGPGAGLSPIYRRLFDPEQYWIIGFDQRGCGKSTPFAELSHNNTASILADMEKIRRHLNIDKWMLTGGSWGTTLALLYAIKRPKKVSAIVLRGVFLAREQDFDWYLSTSGGAAQIFPEYHQAFMEAVNDHPLDSIVDAYLDIFTNGNEIAKMAAAKAWCLWEERISALNSSVQEHDLGQDIHRAISLAILECYYIKNRCFIDENFILDHANKISGIPGTIVHGRYDIVCKLENAHALRQNWRNSQLLIVPESGHSTSEPKIAEAFCHATDAMAKFLLEETP